MYSGTSRTIPIDLGHVLKWLAYSAIAASAPIILLVAHMKNVGGADPALATATAISSVFMLWVMRRAFHWGIRQAIHLHPHKIVFEHITYTQEFSFESAGEWRIDEDNGYWKITALTDQPIKYVPKSAFPSLRFIARRFYATSESDCGDRAVPRVHEPVLPNARSPLRVINGAALAGARWRRPGADAGPAAAPRCAGTTPQAAILPAPYSEACAIRRR